MLGMYICKIINEMGISIMTYFFAYGALTNVRNKQTKKTRLT